MKKNEIDNICCLLFEAANHLEGFESDCECKEIGFRCIKCLRKELFSARAFLLARKFRKIK